MRLVLIVFVPHHVIAFLQVHRLILEIVDGIGEIFLKPCSAPNFLISQHSCDHSNLRDIVVFAKLHRLRRCTRFPQVRHAQQVIDDVVEKLVEHFLRDVVAEQLVEEMLGPDDAMNRL
jgi:hypothetical protein